MLKFLLNLKLKNNFSWYFLFIEIEGRIISKIVIVLKIDKLHTLYIDIEMKMNAFIIFY